MKVLTGLAAAAATIILVWALAPQMMPPKPDAEPVASGAAPAERGEPGVDIVLIVIDALRADRLPFYGHGADTAPFLSHLATRGVLFARAHAPSSWTSTSMASVFTSLYPNQHGVRTGYHMAKQRRLDGTPLFPNRIPPEIETLPMALRALGYRTFAVADNRNISKVMGFRSGFDRFRRGSNRGAAWVNHVVAEYKPELDAADRYFLYVHYMEPHRPYEPTEPWYDQLADDETLAAYDSEIREADEHIRELYELLGWGDDTLIVFTADHGEEFGDHGDIGHHNKLYRELVHVPLLFVWPGRFAPRRVAGNVSTVDLLPTIRELLGAPPRADDTGVSLVPLMRGEEAAPRTIFSMRWSEFREPVLERKAVIFEQWKYIHTHPGGLEELYDTDADPREMRNVIEEHREVAGMLADRLTQFEGSARVYPRAYGTPKQVTPELDAELRALGYVE